MALKLSLRNVYQDIIQLLITKRGCGQCALSCPVVFQIIASYQFNGGLQRGVSLVC